MGTRLLGKYFGNLCATMLPMLTVYAIVLCYIVYVAQNLVAIPMFLLTFVAIALPGQRTILLSTHIIEDIAQTCQNLALMHGGQVLFQGTIAQMLQHARGKVWLATTSGPKPQGNYTIASTLNMGNTTQYRLVGEVYPQLGVTPVTPGLEDSYIWMMHAQKNRLIRYPAHDRLCL